MHINTTSKQITLVAASTFPKKVKLLLYNRLAAKRPAPAAVAPITKGPAKRKYQALSLDWEVSVRVRLTIGDLNTAKKERTSTIRETLLRNAISCCWDWVRKSNWRCQWGGERATNSGWKYPGGNIGFARELLSQNFVYTVTQAKHKPEIFSLACSRYSDRWDSVKRFEKKKQLSGWGRG